MNKGKLSPDERKRVVLLAKQGLLTGRIAQLMDRPRSTIRYWLLTRGFEPCARRMPTNSVTAGRRAFSPEEDRFILQQAAAGITDKEIGIGCEQFGGRRIQSAVYQRRALLMLGDRARTLTAGRPIERSAALSPGGASG